MRIVFAILCCFAACGCSRPVAAPPAALVDAIKQQAFALPQDHYLISDGSEPQYVMVARQLQNTEQNREAFFPTNAVVGEWYYAHRHGEPEKVIAAIRKRSPSSVFSVHFIVEDVCATNASIHVAVSYGDRGGHTRKWQFDRQEQGWTLTGDDRMRYWD